MMVARAIAFGSLWSAAAAELLAATPPMGWSSWYAVGSEVTEKLVKETAELLQRTGLQAKGYSHVNVDEGWMQGRNATTGVPYEDTSMFPAGMRALGEYLHEKKFHYGLYTSRGECQCTTPAYNKRCVPSERSKNHSYLKCEGSKGFELKDGEYFGTYARVDFLKIDSCTGSQDHLEAFSDYKKWAEAIAASKKSTGKDITLSLCGWHDWYAPMGRKIGAQMWRVTGDGNTWQDHLVGIDTMAALTRFNGPGGWNDPDLLIGDTCGPSVGPRCGQTTNQTRVQMSLWAVFPAPLIISYALLLIQRVEVGRYLVGKHANFERSVLGIPSQFSLAHANHRTTDIISDVY